MKSDSCDVLIVGLGPVGATLAGLLRVRGLSVIAIDREADVYPLPRAGAFDDEAMRVFQMLGVSDTLLPMTRAMYGTQFLSASRELLMEFTVPPDGVYGWDWTYVLHQPSIERVLRARLAELNTDVRLSTRLAAFEQDAEGVTASLEGPNGSATISAKYIVGCDGANSRVRGIVGAGEVDYGFSETWLVIDAIVEDGADLPEIATQILDPLQPTTYMHMLGDRYRWEFMLTPGQDAETFASDESIAKLLAPWNENGRIKVERHALYRFRGLIANAWRDGRAFVAGDAAHQMPPFAGQGMCSGFRDASNLAWKLAAVIAGDAPDGLLDSYQQEREPHVRAIIERSIELGKMICVLDPEMAARRDAGMLAMRAAGQKPPILPHPPLQGDLFMGGPASGSPFIQPVAGGRHMDDALGDGPWLISRAPTASEGIKHFILGSGALAPFSAPIAAWLDEQGAKAVLVRPDRQVFGIGDADDLAAAWQSKFAEAAAPVAVS